MNHVILIGNLGRDPEVRFLGSGKAVCRMSLATKSVWTDAAGVKQEQVQWHQIVAWGKLGEACGQYLAKGSKAAVSGEVRYRKYEKDGHDVWTTEISALNVEFLTPRREAEAARPTEPEQQRMPGADDDVPF